MATESVERRLSTILAADVVGYSRIIGRDEAGTVNAVKAQLGEIIDPKAVQYRGPIIKLMGDSVLMEFVSVVDAVLCAVKMQGDLAIQNQDIADDCRMLN